ncbi:hypothetical protein JDV75_06615 [Corynebacterium sp. CCM 8863]|uniref:PPE family protein n=1 Tax=Corynebacterium meridianum TaxID=2765363 RepID=A0A934I6U8_9CORY|nr:hypothetical protein [Corynebacterium meridianum]
MAELGRQHAQVFTGAAGSADDVLTVFKNQAQWLAEALHSTVRALETIDGVTRIQLITGAPGPEVTPEALPFPDRPDADYRPFTFTPPHIPGGGETLAGLSAMFSTTDTAAADRAEQTWTQTATQTAQIADELDHIAAQITDLTDGESFDRAAHTITTVAASARVFSTNARTMGESVARLNPINSWAQAEISAAEVQLALIEEPAEREIAEKAWVSSFLGGSLPAAVSGAVPPISHLMQTPVDAHDGYTTTGDGMTLGTGNAPVVTGGVGVGAGGGTAAAIGSAQSDGEGLVRPDQVGTSAAGAAGGGAPVVSGSGSGVGVPGGGVRPTVTGPATFGGIAHPATAAGAGGGSTGGAGVGVGPGVVGGTGGGRAVSGAPSGGSGKGVAGSTGQRPMVMPGARPGVGPGGVGRAGGSGLPGGSGVPGAGVAPRAGGAVPPGGSGAVGHVGSGGAQGAGVGRGGVAGGVPMVGTGGGRRDRKQSSSVLSQVERSGNLEKILGPAPLTVPPVIGDWARPNPPDAPQG